MMNVISSSLGTILIALMFHLSAGAAEPEPQTAPAREIDLSRFPVLKGTVKSIAGGFLVFTPPRVGDGLTLSIRSLLAGKNDKPLLVNFQTNDANRKYSVIVVPKGRALKSVKYSRNGAFANLRIEAKDGKDRTLIDVVYVKRRGKPTANVWIVDEFNGAFRCAMLLECTVDGDFPTKKLKTNH